MRGLRGRGETILAKVEGVDGFDVVLKRRKSP